MRATPARWSLYAAQSMAESPSADDHPHTSRRDFPRLRLCLGALSLLLCLPPSVSPAFPDADTQPSQYQVEAAFLLNFTKFIDWPPDAFASAEAPFNLCVVGQDPFGDRLERVVGGETVNGRKLTVTRMRRAPAPKTCQIVFVPATEGDAAKVLKASEPRSSDRRRRRGLPPGWRHDRFLHRE